MRWVFASAFCAVWFVAGSASAVRPFVTDDANIVGRGQLTLELFPDVVFHGSEVAGAFNVIGSMSFTEWFELTLGGGAGRGAGRGASIANPVVQPKFLVSPPRANGVPGLAFGTGVTLPVGRGDFYDEATGVFAIAMVTTRLLSDWLLLHVNVGMKSAITPAEGEARRPRDVAVRPYWGAGFDLGVIHPDVRVIGEAYAGDPLVALGPDYGFQWGARWIASDAFSLDLTFGTQPVVDSAGGGYDGWEWWVQLGIRLVFDVFAPEGSPPACGMICRRGASAP